MGFFRTENNTRRQFFGKTLFLIMSVALPPSQRQSDRSIEADGTTPLHRAVLSNDLLAVQALLKTGANPSAANRYNITPLSLAASNGNPRIIEALIAAGGNVKANLPGGQTLLMT